MPDTSNSDKLRRIQWVGSEWDKVARELCNIKPMLINSDTLLDLDKKTFLQAQTILPQDRQRNPAGIPSVSIVRPRLLESLRKIRTEVQAQEAERKAQEAAAAAQAAKAAIPPPPPPNPYEVAFAPLVDLIANKVASIMQDQLKQLIAQVAPRAANAEFRNLPGVNGRAKPKLAVMGGLPVQNNDIQQAYPNVDFVFIGSNDKAFNLDRLEHVDFVIALTDFLNHSSTDKVKTKYSEKYKPVTGSVSAAKRLIGILLNQLNYEQTPEPQARAANLH